MTLLESSSVHPQETSQNPPLPSTYREHLKALDPAEFEAANETLAYLYPDDDHPIRNSFRGCRTRAYFVRHKKTGEVQVHSKQCKNRICPFCSHGKAARISHNVFDWVKTLDRPKLVTLTLKHSTAPLDDQLNHLYQHFRTWRGRKPMSAAIHGGIWFVQVTLNPDDQTWHPHLHVILDADWVPQADLAKAWLDVTRTSSILDIRQIRSAEKAASYVARYVARPGNLSEMPVDYRAEVYHAFQNRRSCGTFGSAREARLTLREKFNHGDWESLGSYSLVATLARSDPDAWEILHAWKHRLPLAKGITFASVDRAIDWGEGEPETLRKKSVNPPRGLWS